MLFPVATSLCVSNSMQIIHYYRTLRKLIANKDEDWEDYLNGVLFAINTNTSTTTKYSPFFLMYGRNPVFPMESEVQSMQLLP